MLLQGVGEPYAGSLEELRGPGHVAIGDRQRLDALIDQRRAELDLQRRNAIPDVSIGAGYDVAPRGRLPQNIIEAYEAAH